MQGGGGAGGSGETAHREGDLGFVWVLLFKAGRAAWKDPGKMCSLPARLPDNQSTRHSDAIHCHLLVYRRFLFKPLHSSLGRAPLVPHPAPPSLGPGRKREALSVLIALLDQGAHVRLSHLGRLLDMIAGCQPARTSSGCPRGEWRLQHRLVCSRPPSSRHPHHPNLTPPGHFCS